MQNDKPFHWDDKCQTAFENLKNALITAPMLTYPDMNVPFILSTDAICTAIGYILGQKDSDEKEMVVAYGGQSLRPDKRKYTVSEQECLVVVEGIKAYKEYLSHQKFTIFTDHQALKWLHSIKNPSTRLGRWAILLQEYQYDIVHKQGRVHLNADALSRRTYDNDIHTEQTNNTVNSVEQKPQQEHREYLQVEFAYGAPIPVSVAELAEENTDKDLSKDIDGTSIAELQKECIDFQHIFSYLENNTLPDDKKLANKVVIESNQYALFDGVLYHFYQPRVKSLPAAQWLVRQLALLGALRQDVLHSFHDSHARSGHLGVQKTFAPIRERYFFPGMYQVIHDFRSYMTMSQLLTYVSL